MPNCITCSDSNTCTKCENNYYIDFANDRVFDIVSEVSDGSDEWDGCTVRMGNMTKALIDSINELCPGRTEGYEFDENLPDYCRKRNIIIRSYISNINNIRR